MGDPFNNRAPRIIWTRKPLYHNKVVAQEGNTETVLRVYVAAYTVCLIDIVYCASNLHITETGSICQC